MSDKPTIVVRDMYMSDLTRPAKMPGRFRAWWAGYPTGVVVATTMAEAIGRLILRGGAVNIETETD
jgi:hypothetical protein